MPAFPAPLGPETAVTPYRRSSLVLDTPVWALNRQHWYHSRSADQIARATDARAGQNRNVELLPSFAWVLRAQAIDYTYSVSETYQERLSPSIFNVSPYVTHYLSWRAPDLPGVPTGEGVTNEGVPFFTKSVPAGVSWEEIRLEADELAYSKPTQVSEKYPLDRVLAGNRTWGANQSFLFAFMMPTLPYAGFDNLHTFYWGGESDTEPEGLQAGGWCVTFHGDGNATLFERVENQWFQRFRFRYSTAGRGSGGMQWVYIQPLRDNRIIFTCPLGEGDPQGASASQQGQALSRRQGVSKSVYKHSVALSGHAYKKSICGAGVVRVDARRDIRFLFQVGTLDYPAFGTVIDLPFAVNHHIGEGTVIRVSPQVRVPNGTVVSVQLYDADTHQPLSAVAGSDTQFYSVANQTAYYAAFTLQSIDGDHTPELLGYEVEIDGFSELLEPPTVTLSNITGYEIEGAGTDPSNELATLRLEDTANAAALLRSRARIPCQIRTAYDQEGHETVLFEGEVARAPQRETNLTDGRTKRGYNVRLVGMWAHLWDQTIDSLEPFGFDTTADPVDSDQPPWKVTDLVAYLLRKAGFPDEAIDVPNSDLRLWPTDNIKDNWVLQPGTRIGSVIVELLDRYLDSVLVWCPNSGQWGMWRVIARPTTFAGTPLWTFVEGPTAGRKLVHVPGAYPEKTTFLRRGTVETYPQAPEANSVLVRGRSRAGLPGDSGSHIISQWMWNPRSFNQNADQPTVVDRAHPDYIGREVRLSFYDESLQTQEAVDFVCRRVFDAVAYGRQWAVFEAPLVLVTDPDDPHQTRPRPLRFGDEVVVNGVPGIINAVSIQVESDRAQLAQYEVLLTPLAGGQF